MKAPLLLFLCAAATASAGDYVSDCEFEDLDIAALRAGEWVDYEILSESKRDDGSTESSRRVERLACVRTDGEFAWIERLYRDADKPEWKYVVLYQIRKSDRRVVAGWSGRPGEAGTEAELLKEATPINRAPREGPPPAGRMTEEKITVAGKEVVARKLETRLAEKEEEHIFRGKVTIWTRDDVPFRTHFEDPEVLTRQFHEAVWEKRPSGPAAVVRREYRTEEQREVTELIGHGTDAKPTLKR